MFFFTTRERHFAAGGREDQSCSQVHASEDEHERSRKPRPAKAASCQRIDEKQRCRAKQNRASEKGQRSDRRRKIHIRMHFVLIAARSGRKALYFAKRGGKKKEKLTARAFA